MPQLAGAELTLWRTHPQSVDVYCYLLNPTVRASRRVNMSSITYPLHTITFDNADSDPGDTATVLADEAIQVRDGTTGEHKTYLRVRAAPAGNTVQIGVKSPGEIGFVGLADNDILDFLYTRRIESKQPSVDGSGAPLKDWGISFNLAASQPPVANAGPWYARKIDPSTNLITVDFDGSTSYPIREGATITAYQWDFEDGSVISGSAASATATVTFPAGYRWISLTVTDSNSQTHTAYALIVAADNDTAVPVEVASLNGQLTDGWQCGINTLGADVGDYPPGTIVMVWAEERYGTTPGSLNGFADREHVKFTGWIVDDVTTVRPHTSDWQIQAVGPIGMMQRITSYPYSFTHSTAPDSWFFIEHLTYWRFIHHLLHWDSTVLALCDVERSPVYNVYPSPFYDAESGAFINQLTVHTEGVAAKVTCDCRGRLYFRRHPHMMGASERAALPTIVNLEAQDWTGDVTIRTRNHEPVSLVEGYGGLAVGAEYIAMKSIAPGTTQGQGPSKQTLNRQICVSQTELNERVGRYYALKNLTQPDMSLNILGQGIVADPAWQELVLMDLEVSSNARAIGYDDERFLLTENTVEYDHRSHSCEEQWRLEKLTPDIVVKGNTVVLPGVDPPDGDEPYIPSDGTYLDQPTNDIDIFPPILIPDEVGDTLEVFAWTAAFLAGAAGIAPTYWYPMYEAASAIMDVLYNPNTPYPQDKSGPLGVYVLDYDNGTGLTKLMYSPSALSLDGPIYNEREEFGEQATILRTPRGVPDGLEVFIRAAGQETYTVDFGAGYADYSVLQGTDASGYVELIGLSDVDPYANGGCEVRVNFDSPVTLTDIQFDVWSDWDDPDGNHFWRVQAFDSGDTLLDTPIDRNELKTFLTKSAWTSTDSGYYDGTPFPLANVSYIKVLFRTQYGGPALSFGTATMRLDNIVIDVVLSAPPQVAFSDDTGKTFTTKSLANFDAGVATGAMDTDDYGLEICLAAFGDRINYRVGRDSSFAAASGADVSPSRHVAIRVPSMKFTDPQAANSDPEALEFLFATRDKLSDDSTLWWATINTTTGVITDGGDITPVIAAVTYVCIENPNALDTYGGNPNRLRMLARDESNESDDTVLIGSVDGGQTWTLEQDPADYVRLWHTGSNALYMAGEDGLKWTADGGDNLSDFDGDYETAVDVFPLEGVFAV